ncbi:MAG: hypothetical protein IJ962_00800 [Clostridia bacterium]|nr:hypothetical protein [Clostridia bacterium]
MQFWKVPTPEATAPIDQSSPTVVVPPPPVTDKEEENEDEPQKLNFFERIIQWFKNLFERLFGKRD